MKGMAAMLAFLLIVPLAEGVTVETFASPDCSFAAISGFIEGAHDSLAVSTYTFSSPEIAEILVMKENEGVDVEVLVEKSPAGGVSQAEEELLCVLTDGGVGVYLYDGPLKYMHAKYVVRDDESVLVASENIGYSGFFPDGSFGNRGWGAIVRDPEVAGSFAGAFEEDVEGSIEFSCGLESYGAEKWDVAGAYVPHFIPTSYEGQEAAFVSSPDSMDEILSIIGSANTSLLVEQFYIYTHWGSPTKDSVESAPSPLIEALVRKAREGVEVRLLLDSTYYNMDPEKSVSNHNTIMLLNCIAEEEGIPLEAAAVNADAHGLSVVHNKGVVSDRRQALVSSINWNENSVMNNRETGVIITGDAAGYYADIFESDWEDAQRINCDGSVATVSIRSGFPAAVEGALPAAASLLALSAAVIYLHKRKIS